MHKFPHIEGMTQEQIPWPSSKGKVVGRNGGNHRITTLTVLEYTPEHLKLMRPGQGWASPANQYLLDYRDRPTNVGGYGDYYGRDCVNEKWLEERIEKGWPEGVAKVQPLIEKIRDLVPMATRKRRKPRWSDQGDEIDMRKVWSGQLDTAWRSTRKVRVEGERVISIDIAVGHNAFVGAKQLFWAGAAGVAMTDVLEERGYRVELFATAAVISNDGNRDHAAISRLQVKRADQPLNLYDVAILCAHPASFRWYGINSWARMPDSIGYGFGQSLVIEPALEVARDRGVIGGTDLVVENALSEKDAVQQILLAVEKMDERSGAPL